MPREESHTYLERLSPRRFGTWGCCVTDNSMQFALEENQHTVHDAHDEMGWTSQLSNRCYQHTSKFRGYIFRCPICSSDIFYTLQMFDFALNYSWQLYLCYCSFII